jgi:hypothetical protein
VMDMRDFISNMGFLTPEPLLWNTAGYVTLSVHCC